MARAYWPLSVGLAALTSLTVAAACAPSTPNPTAAPQKPAATSAPAASPAAGAASPAAKPAASPAASPGAAAPAAPAAGAPAAKPVAVNKLPDFPTRQIEIIVPFAPGGGFDTVARQLAIPMQRTLGQPVVVRNIDGGGQRVAARTLQTAPADGYTIGYFAEPPLFVSTFVEPAEGFNLQSWTNIAGVRKSPFALIVRKDSPFTTVEQIIAADRAGQRLRMGNEGVGGHLTQHVVLAEGLGLTNAVHIGGFRGSADIAPSVLRGDTDLVFGSPITSWMRFIESGDMRAIFVLEPQRSPLLPDVPTARELNVPGTAEMEAALSTFLYGVTAAPGVPADRVAVLEAAVLNALQDPEFLAWANGAGVAADLSPMSSRDFQTNKTRYQESLSKYQDALRRANQ